MTRLHLIRALLLAGAVAALPGTAAASHGPAASMSAGLVNQGLAPSSTGLQAPLGDRAAAPVPADPRAAAEDPPLRVYVLVVDGLLPSQIGLRTPTLNQLKGEGTWWEQARAVLPAETLPNHAAMATGVIPRRNGIIANQFNRGQVYREYMQYPEFWQADTIVTRLERAYGGAIDTATILSKEYLYGLFRGEHPGAADPLPQLEADFHWDPRTQPAYIVSPSAHATDVASVDALLGWIEAEKASPRPQFALVNLGDVDRAGHADAEGVAPAAADRAASGDDELSGLFSSPFQQVALEDTDAQIGRVVQELKESGAWENSVLMVLSDHGMDWGAQHQFADTAGALAKAGYEKSIDSGRRNGDFTLVAGGGSELVYVYDPRDVDAMARVLCGVEGVAVVATREPVEGLPSGCRRRSLAELGLDHPYSPEIELFMEPGWRSTGTDASANPLPGNHGHAVTQHSVLMVAGGHPAVKAGGSIPGERVYARGDLAPPAGPGVLSVAPTVAGLFDIGAPPGGYDAPPLAEAFEPGAVELDSTEAAGEPPAGGAEDEAAGGPGTLVAVGSDVVGAGLTRATYSIYAANLGDAPASDVVVTAPVPFNTTFAGAELAPVDPASCTAGAAAGVTCRWAIGDLAPGASTRFEVTFDLAQTTTSYNVALQVSSQVAGAEPAAGDPADLDGSLYRDVKTPFEDVHVADDAPPGTNYGKCNVLRIGATTSAFLGKDPLLPTGETGYDSLTKRIESLWAAELQATVAAAPIAAAGLDSVGVHRVTSRNFFEGQADCAGTAPAGSLANTRDARTGSAPVAEADAVATAPVPAAGETMRWNVLPALDEFMERRDFTGFALRHAAGVAAGTLELNSGEAAPALQPRLVLVYQRRRLPTCIDADPETPQRESDRRQRLRAYVSDGALITSGSEQACGGTPVPGAPVGWELDDDSPDTFVESAAGVPVERTVGRNGTAGPDRVSTVTGPRGRTFVDVRLPRPYAAGENAGAIRAAAILLKESHDAYDAPGYGSSQGVCEPGDAGALGQELTCTGESAIEDDVATTWVPVEPPSLTIEGALAGESAGVAELTLRLSRASELPVDVAYATEPGTAAAGSDFEARSGRLSFAPGETEKTLRVPIAADSADEPDEAFTVVLSAPEHAVLGPDAQATVTIADDDEAPPPGPGPGPPDPVAPPPLAVLQEPVVPPAPVLDTLAPRSRFVAVPRRAGGALAGVSEDAAPAGALPRLAAVHVAVGLATGSGCRFLLSTGRLGPKVSCARTRYLRARGTTRFRLRLPRGLPAGRYLAWARGVDEAGNVERKDRRRNLSRFTITG